MESTVKDFPLNLTSLKGLSLAGLPRVVEVSDGSQEGMEAEITAQLQPLTQATSQPSTAVIQKSSPPVKPERAKRKRAERTKAEDMTVDSETLPGDQPPTEPQPDATPQPDAKFEITSSESLGRLDDFLQRFRVFGFNIPSATALTWQSQTIDQLKKVLFAWESDRRHCENGTAVLASSRDLVPPLICTFDAPASFQLLVARNEGVEARIVRNFSVAHNPYPVATELAGKWSEGFRQAEATIVKPSGKFPSTTIASMPTLGTDASSIIQSGIRRVQADIDRQSRIDSLLSQLFAERDTVAALQEEITETKASLKNLTESRDEHQTEEERIIEMLKVETENSKEEE